MSKTPTGEKAVSKSTSGGSDRRSSRLGSGGEQKVSKTGSGERRASKSGTVERRASRLPTGGKDGKSSTSKAGAKATATKSKGKEGQGRGRKGKAGQGKIPAAWGAPQLAGEDGEGNSPLVIAVKCRHKDVARVLIDFEAPLEVADPDGNTPLIQAALLGERTLVEDLLLAGARRDAQNMFGAQAVHVTDHLGIRNLLIACAAEELVAEAILKSGALGDEDAPPPGERTVYRVRLDGLPLLVLVEDVQELVEALLRRVLHNATLPLRVTAVADPITARPQGYAYADFLRKDEAAELVRRKRNCRLGPRRVNLINEGARLEQIVEDEN